MLDPNPVIYVMSKKAMEQYCRQEGIPAKRLPDLVANDDDVLAGVRHLVRTVRRVLALRRPVGRPQPRGAGQGVVAK